MEVSASALSFSPLLASLPSPPCTPRPLTLTLAISRFGGDQEGPRTGGGAGLVQGLASSASCGGTAPTQKPLPTPPGIPGNPQPPSAQPLLAEAHSPARASP